MRYFCPTEAIPIFLCATALFGESALVVPDAKVGRNLQKAVRLTLGEPAPDEGVDITLRSSEPGRLRFSKSPDQAGAASLVLRVRQGYRESAEFWLQALGTDGAVTYTATAAGYPIATATVTVTPSAIVIVGPLKAPKFLTTTGSAPTRVALYSVCLDSSFQFAEEQSVAGGGSIRVEIGNSNPSAGTIANSTLEIRGGASSAETRFQPKGEGETTLSAGVPSGFHIPAQFAAITASVRRPGLALSDQLVIGRNLQVGGVLNLGEYAPSAGLKVTLVSSDPSRLLLSPSATEIGSKSITVAFPADGVVQRYYLQALADSGTIEYTATAPGFRTRTAIVTLAPSGIVITPAWQGPPDEAHVLRKETPDGTYKITAVLSKPAPTNLVAWTAYLDPVTHRSADITVQPLRAGFSVTVPLTNSNPGVGTIVSQVIIAGGSDHSVAEFKPVSVGSTEISVTTPKDFVQSSNSTTVVADVRK